MKKIRLLTLFVIICLLFSAAAPAAFALDAPQLNGQAAIVVDLDSGKIIYELNKDEERSPASLTKIMTVLLTLERLERGDFALSDMVTAGADCRQGMGEDSSSSGILPGVTLSVEDLLYCALLQSANEACNILGSFVAGSITDFVDLMNQKAAELGCEHTHFANTNGLTADGHYSSAYDLYIITKAAMQYPLFMQIANTPSYQAASPAVNNGYPISNSNALISAGSIYGSNYLYDGASGVKTGYTRAAGYCLVSTAQRGAMSVMAIVLGCDGQLNSDSKEYWNFIDSRTLYDWTFDNFSYRNILSTTEPITRVNVSLAAGDGVAILRPAEDLTLLMPNEVPTESIVRSVTVYEQKLVAPIAAGTVLGEMRLSADGVIYGTVKLVNSSSIELSRTEYIKTRVRDILTNGWVIAAACVIGFILLMYIILVLRYRRLRQKHLREVRRAEQQRRAERERAYAKANSAKQAPKKTPVRRTEPDDPDDFDIDAILKDDFFDDDFFTGR